MADPGHAARDLRGRRHRGRRAGRRSAAAGIQQGRPGVRHQRPGRGTGHLMTGQHVAEAFIGPTTLSDLDEPGRYRRFDELQTRLPRVWDSMKLNVDGESVVVVPSVSLDRAVDNSGSLNQAYEERYLFLLLLLRQPRLRMIYVTSMPVAPAIVEYYLALL